MNSETVIYILLVAVTALFLALFQYVYKAKHKKLRWVFVALRFIALLSIGVLLINPKFESFTYYIEKPTLVIATDNSESIAHLQQTDKVKDVLKRLSADEALNTRFTTKAYSFGASIVASDSLSFSEKQSNISETLTELNTIYANTTAPILLLSDGNQTFGSDYSYTKSKQPIFPVILGDTTTYTDIAIQQINVNRYVYLKNKFPVEIIATYSGNTVISTELVITSDNTTVFKKTLQFSPQKTAAIVNATLTATSVGVKSYTVTLTPLQTERNTINNTQDFAVEVIDQKTNIALVSDIMHPDLGALKKAIESNAQRNVTIVKPNEYLPNADDYQLAIIFQPTSSYTGVLNYITTNKRNSFIVTGLSTDYAVLNAANIGFTQTITNQTEEFQPNRNTNYTTFLVDDIGFENFPPLASEFGIANFVVPTEDILYRTVSGITTETPMLSTFENNNSKHAVLFGEGIWRWRAQSYLDQGNFVSFDTFINKLVQYLSSNTRRERLKVDYKSFYSGNESIAIAAQYFNKNYEVDANASLELSLTHTTKKTTVSYPLLGNRFNYTIALDGLEAGSYDFTIKKTDEPISKHGSFKVLEYNVEHQFLNADSKKLQRLAARSYGVSAFIDHPDSLLDVLRNDDRFQSIQKSKREVVSLIDWKYLLGLIALVLSLEWFIRKYNGLI